MTQSSTLTKKCVYCKIEKPLSDYPKHINHKDNLDSRCRECIRKGAKVRARIRKTAPPKPDVCQCCGRVPLAYNSDKVKWCMDHDHITETFRGWVCEDCNLGIGKLGDNIEGLEKAVRYLKECGYQ